MSKMSMILLNFDNTIDLNKGFIFPDHLIIPIIVPKWPYTVKRRKNC